MIRTKSIFEKKSESDGARICVMRWVKQSYNQGGGARVMNEILFKQEMMRAEGLKSVDPSMSDYFSGYMRGLRRAFHGEQFGTDDEHEKWLSLYDDSDQGRRDKGLGYRHGLKGQVFGGKDYCTQNAGDCTTCSRMNYGKDYKNNLIN